MKIEYEEARALIEKDATEGLKRVMAIADDGYIPAISFLGDCYLTGQYTETNYSSAIQWYSKAAACDDPYSQRMIGTMYLMGNGVSENHEEALNWFLLAAENGDMLGQFYSAQLLYKGLGAIKNIDDTVKWYTLAANQGHGESCLKLGDIYADGTDGIQKNKSKAIKYYQLATKYGVEEARSKFEELYKYELEVRVGNAISKGLTETQLMEFDSISDATEASKWLQENKPDYRTIVNDKTKEMEYEFPLIKYGLKKYQIPKSKYEHIRDVYEEHKKDNPEEMLNAIEAFFIFEGIEYQAGLLSEEDYYLKTDSRILLGKILKMKGNSKLKLPMVKEFNRFVHAFDEWKESHEIKEKPWMKKIIESDMEIKEAADWVFTVIDTLKIPMRYLTSFDTEEYPNMFFKIKNDEIIAGLAEKCIDIEQITADPDPIGKEYILNFDKGSTMHVRIDEKNNGDYVAKGIINDYMCKRGRIEIEIDNDEAFVYFDKYAISPIQGLWGTYMLPNLNKKWESWDRSRLEHSYRFEMEYKTLRIPYMIHS